MPRFEENTNQTNNQHAGQINGTTGYEKLLYSV